MEKIKKKKEICLNVIKMKTNQKSAGTIKNKEKSSKAHQKVNQNLTGSLRNTENTWKSTKT